MDAVRGKEALWLVNLLMALLQLYQSLAPCATKKMRERTVEELTSILVNRCFSTRCAQFVSINVDQIAQEQEIEGTQHPVNLKMQHNVQAFV